MNDKNKKSEEPKREPNYLKLLNSKPSNSKVGKVFIVSTNKRKPDDKK